MGKLTQVCLQLLLLPSLLLCSFKCLICLSMTPGKACAAGAWEREGASLSSTCGAVSRRGGEVQSWYWQWHWAPSHRREIWPRWNIRWCYFREIHFFHFLMGLSPVFGSHCQPCPSAAPLCGRIWHEVPEWESCWSWRWIWRAFVFTDLHQLKTVLSWGASEGTLYSWKLQCLSKWSVWPPKEGLKPRYFLVSHGLLQSLVSFWLLLLFQEFLSSVNTLIQPSLPLWAFAVTCYHL